MDAHKSEEICINEYDIDTIDRVIANLDLETKLNIDIGKISSVLLRKGVITKSGFDTVHANTKNANTSGTRLLLFHRFIWEIVAYLTFSDFVLVIFEAEYFDLGEMLISHRKEKKRENVSKLNIRDDTCQVTVYSNDDKRLPLCRVEKLSTGYDMVSQMPKRHLPHAESLLKYYTGLKMLVDNNAFEKGNREELNCRIKALDESIQSCSNQSRKQLLVDKRVEMYFLLTQQYADFRERNGVLVRLRDSMPQGIEIDRTAFDILFHSYMSINCAFRSDFETADTHMSRAVTTCATCLPCLPIVVMVLSLQIMSSVIGTQWGTSEYLQRIEHVCENALNVTGAFSSTEEEDRFWKRSVMIQKACSFLGINNYCKIRQDLPDTNRAVIEKVRETLSKVQTIKGPIQYRRKMFLYFCLGRFHDITGNKTSALKYVRKARALEDKGCFDEQEKLNMSEYEKQLEDKLLGLH